ncbi:MAG: TonB-dependent receptor [Bacteroidales bacterium]|nr:TonB-dependent receptor [Bacteroidales bacterium]
MRRLMLVAFIFLGTLQGMQAQNTLKGTILAKDHPSRFESPTEGYFLMGLNLGTQVSIASRQVHLGVTVNNLFDVKYTDHLSTLKNLQYNNMGRNIIFRILLPFGYSL